MYSESIQQPRYYPSLRMEKHAAEASPGTAVASIIINKNANARTSHCMQKGGGAGAGI